ncbi:MAG TPA: hypothetical protein PKC21_06595 [Oligoflexia bacterium]|nr:hypothetical protein [Oligoflexia bacterium]HMR25004.1 hypothetical protein [Oligoflexia bacterium]
MKKILFLFFCLGLNVLYAQEKMHCTDNGCNFTEVYNSIEHCQYLDSAVFNPAQLNALIVGKMDNVYMFSINKNSQSMSMMAKLNDFISHKDITIAMDVSFSEPLGYANYHYIEYHTKSEQYLMDVEDSFNLTALSALKLDEKQFYQLNNIYSEQGLNKQVAIGLNSIEFGIKTIKNTFPQIMQTMDVYETKDKQFYYNLTHCIEGFLLSLKQGLI